MTGEIRDVLRMLPEATIFVDLGGRIIEASPAAGRLLGFDVDVLIGRALDSLVAESRESVASLLRSAASTAQTLPAALHLPRGDGTLTKLRVDACRYSAADADDPLVFMRLVSADGMSSQLAVLNRKLAELAEEVAERRRVEAIIRSQRDVLELMLNGAPIEQVLDELLRTVESLAGAGVAASILLLDETGTRLYHGAAPSLPESYTRAIDGLPVGPTSGSCGTAVYRRSTVVAANIATDPLWAAYRELALSHGLRSCWSTPLFATNGSVLGTFATYYPTSREPNARDIQLIQLVTRTASIAIERKRFELERSRLLESEREARSHAEEASRLKDEFLMTVSHELRTPLNAILGWAQLLRSSTEDDQEAIRALDTILRNARAQAQIIEDLLDMSQIITGRLRLHIRTVDLRDAVDEALESVRPAAESRRIRLLVEAEEGVGVMRGDPDRLQQVVWNLLSNAVKFTPESGVIRIRLTHAGDGVRLTVTDTGCGVAPELLPHIFERFRQADSSSVRRHGGLGLGLSIVRNLVELHGGMVQARSEGVGKGMEMEVWMPSGRHVGPDADGDQSSGRKSDADRERALRDQPALAGLRVLVVEDEEDSRTVLTLVLERAGAEVLSASGSREAMALLENDWVDVIVSDVQMPDEDGYEMIQRLRERRGTVQVPAIALSAFTRIEDRLRALRAGFQLHIGKPFDAVELVESVAALAASQPGSVPT